MTFKGLHETIQAAFLWFGSHLWEFDFAGRTYGLPFDDGFGGERIYKADTARLTKLKDTGVTEFWYVYDMGDNWKHRIEVVDLFAAEKGARLPRFLDGKWRAPPEDVGGAPGFEMFLQALTDPEHPEHEDLTEWYGQLFDPEDIEADIIKARMNRLAAMRNRGR